MWWRGQNLDKPIPGPDGRSWHFRVWHGTDDGGYVQRVFFWDGERTETGLVELRGSRRLHVIRLKCLMSRVAKDAEYRAAFLRPLAFPLERHW